MKVHFGIISNSKKISVVDNILKSVFGDINCLIEETRRESYHKNTSQMIIEGFIKDYDYVSLEQVFKQLLNPISNSWYIQINTEDDNALELSTICDSGFSIKGLEWINFEIEISHFSMN